MIDGVHLCVLFGHQSNYETGVAISSQRVKTMQIKDLNMNEFGFSEAGRIRLGIKKVSRNGKEYPAEVDYFVLNDAPDLIPLYGNKPKELLVYLPHQTLDRNFRTFYALYKSGGMYCQGDGEFIRWAIDPVKGAEVVIKDGFTILPYEEEDGTEICRGKRIECSGKERKRTPLYPRCEDCGMHGLLHIIVRDPKEPYRWANNRLAYYQMSTGSFYNIVGLTESLNTMVMLASNMNKSLAGIPLILRRTERTMAVTTDKGRSQVTKHFLALEADPAWVEYASLGLVAHSMDKPIEDLMALPEGVIDGDIVDEDLYTPDELIRDVDENLAQKIADIEAMKGDIPATLGEMHARIEELYGDGYNRGNATKAIKRRAGLSRTDKFECNQLTWTTALELMLERIGAQ